MKKTVPEKKILRSSLPGLFSIAFMLVVAVSSAKSGNAVHIKVTGINNYDTIVVSTFSANKKSNIRLYPDANRQALLVSANSRQEKRYQFYMFDMEGKLVRQASILNRETTIFDNIFKGNYFFEIFSNDERVEHGQLMVR